MRGRTLSDGPAAIVRLLLRLPFAGLRRPVCSLPCHNRTLHCNRDIDFADGCKLVDVAPVSVYIVKALIT